MSKMNSVVHFEMPYDDRKRMAKFYRSEEHTSELQSLRHLVCRLLLETEKRLPLRLPRPVRPRNPAQAASTPTLEKRLRWSSSRRPCTSRWRCSPSAPTRCGRGWGGRI